MAFTKKVVVEEKPKDPGPDILKLVDVLHEERKISKETIFKGIAAAIQSAIEKKLMVEEGVFVSIDEATGHIVARHGEHDMDPVELGRIAAQSAK